MHNKVYDAKTTFNSTPTTATSTDILNTNMNLNIIPPTL